MSIVRPDPSPGRLGVVEAHRMLQEATAVLLDVRETAEWQAGHAPGAQHLPMSQLAAGAQVPSPPADSRLVLICRSGKRSRTAALLLRERGTDAVDVAGGMEEWVRQSLPIQDAAGAAGTVI
ncbi:rhodanese-like domain-containing protein [Streptomyces sp. NPDC002809]|uniref:rhodanese-like domain-containing protein n=1 Tax=Streptomyces sp. NPDC002809 TaxID=3154433 RepID=UPI00332C5CE2